jgi:pimeloyl-ACP methyl ester carboxylesterase
MGSDAQAMNVALDDTEPAWFRWAVAQPRIEHRLASLDGTALHLAGWNADECDKPPLLLVHGYRGNSHWWDFIAPWLCTTHRVFALDLAGMGESGRRAAYAPTTFTDDVIVAAEYLALEAPAGKVAIAAHSFSGSRLLEACARAPHSIGHAVVLDSRAALLGDAPHRRSPVGNPRPYPDRDAAMARFRLLPDQPHLPYLGRYLAGKSLRQVDGGWTWQFDRALPVGMMGSPLEDFARDIAVPVDLVRGELSVVLDAPRAQHIAALLPHCRGPIELPGAHHHLMLDQPLALVATLRCLLACPPRR